MLASLFVFSPPKKVPNINFTVIRVVISKSNTDVLRSLSPHFLINVVDSMSNIQHEYDPLAQIRELEMCKFNHSSHSGLSTTCKDSVPAKLVVC
jgi:hypothetical protein